MARLKPAIAGLMVGSLALAPAAWAASTFEAAVAGIEARMHGRIGVFAMCGGRAVGCRAEERFAHCSVAKWVLVAAVLKEAEQDLGRTVPFRREDLVSDSPVTSAHLAEGRMSIEGLCAATIELSDNTAANLLEPLVGGPGGLQSFVRNLGDPGQTHVRIMVPVVVNLVIC